MMITLEDYFGHWIDHPDATLERKAAAEAFLPKLNALLTDAEQNGVTTSVNPKTGTLVSGMQYGGFRPQDCPEGAPDSSHKIGRGCDVFDPSNTLDKWLDRFEDGHGGNSKLTEHGLYRESPTATACWCHLTDRAPHSGRRTFIP